MSYQGHLEKKAQERETEAMEAAGGGVMIGRKDLEALVKNTGQLAAILWALGKGEEAEAMTHTVVAAKLALSQQETAPGGGEVDA